MKEYLLVFIILLFSMCKEEKKQEFYVPPFSILYDLEGFVKKMPETDTLRVEIDMAVCLGRGFEINEFTKQNDTVYIRTDVGIIDYDRNEYDFIDIGKKIYTYFEQDTLNFEDFFRRPRNLEEYNHRPFIRIIHKNDTIDYFATDIIDKQEGIRHYYDIKQRIYPERDYRSRLKPPPPPSGSQGRVP